MPQEDDADEEDDAETPHSTLGGAPNGPLQHHRSGRSASMDTPDGAPGSSPLRPTTSSTAGGRRSDAEQRSMQRSARMKVHILRLVASGMCCNVKHLSWVQGRARGWLSHRE